MTDNEIIKALECCNTGNDCKNCPLMRRTDVNCNDTLKKEALDIIKRQQAEIERLKEREEKHHQLYEETKKILVRQSKLEAIGEFAERLKTKMIDWCFDFEYYSEQQLAEEQVDNLVKEITEADNGA